MVLMAIIMLALFAITAAVIDVGRVMLYRRQMQAAVNTAAVEGLRFRDGIPESWRADPPQALTDAAAAHNIRTDDPDDPTYIDFARRWSASNLARQVLFSPATGTALARVPKVTVEPDPFGPFPPFIQNIDPADSYDDYPPKESTVPVLQPNLDKSGSQINVRGDLVGGAYVASDGLHSETLPSYVRSDFTPYTELSANSDYHSDANSAFIARLRRTGEENDGVSQSSARRSRSYSR